MDFIIVSRHRFNPVCPAFYRVLLEVGPRDPYILLSKIPEDAEL